jgi:hypothetical protein
MLRDKTAEFDALRTLDTPNKGMILPVVVAASFFVKDQEKTRQLTKDEYLSEHLGRIAKSWGARTCLLDTRFLKLDKEAQQDASDLAKFLNAGRKFGCSIIPTFDLKTSNFRCSAISSHWQSTGNGLALRLTLSDLSDPGLRTKIHSLLIKMVVKPQQCVLILDLSDADLSEVDAFAAFEEFRNMACGGESLLPPRIIPRKIPLPKTAKPKLAGTNGSPGNKPSH